MQIDCSDEHRAKVATLKVFSRESGVKVRAPRLRHSQKQSVDNTSTDAGIEIDFNSKQAENVAFPNRESWEAKSNAMYASSSQFVKLSLEKVSTDQGTQTNVEFKLGEHGLFWTVTRKNSPRTAKRARGRDPCPE
jgi:hypothetical protein